MLKKLLSISFKIKDFSGGFTLVELLAVIIVFSLISGIGSVILVTSLRTSTKTNTLTNVKQNGNYVITQMTKVIRNAVSVSPNCTVAVYPTPVPTITAISVTDSTGLQTIFTCDTQNTSITYYTSVNTTPQSLLDTNAVLTTSCGFSCSQSSVTDYPVVGISFSLVSAKPTGVVENTASANPIPFFTGITLRNKNR